jgi:phosphomannomutase/phosphoglucomutase
VEKLRLFGTSGIRGKAKIDMTSTLALKLGHTFASFLGNEGTVIVGRDVRLFANDLSKALISGLLSSGLNVEDCGIAPTPAILWALKKRELTGAVVITGSHTPKDMIGFLFFLKDTSELSYEDSIQFENLYNTEINKVSYNHLGKLFEIDVSKIYLESLFEQVDINKISSLNYKVVLDPGNGASTFFCSDIFKKAEIKTLIINNEPNGLFPNRDPYPRPEVLNELSSKVREINADLGSASDGDGDRAIFVNDQGKVLWGDLSGAIFAKDALINHGGGTIVTPINSSQMIAWVCQNYGGNLFFTKIGPPYIVKTMKEKGAIMGLEETGKNIWPNGIFYGDWVLATLKMLEIMAREGKSLSDIAKTFPNFYMKKETFYCDTNMKTKVLTQVLEEWKKRNEQAQLIFIDGIRINYEDNSWILFKPSGTEPVFRVYSESINPDRVEELANMGSKIVKKILRGCH